MLLDRSTNQEARRRLGKNMKPLVKSKRKENIGAEAKQLRERDIAMEEKLPLNRSMKQEAKRSPKRNMKMGARRLQENGTERQAKLSRKEDTTKKGKVVAKQKYQSGGRALARMTYHVLGAKDADVQQHYALTKSSYFKPGNLDVEQAWGVAAVNLQSIEQAWYLNDAQLYPPSYTAIHDPANLKAIQEFHLFLDSPVWMTCVRCFKAWYSVQKDFVFSQSSCRDDAWFSVTDSEILRRWCFDGSTSEVDAEALVRANPNLVECLCGATGLAAGLIDVCNQCKSSTWNIKICVCRECFVNLRQWDL